jgi:hypothetical protein
VNWILGVSKLYRNNNLQVYNNLIFLDTEDGIFYTVLENDLQRKFSFVPSLLNRSKPDTEIFLSDKMEIRTGNFRTFSALYKISQAAADTIVYARQQKAQMKVTMSLYPEKLVIKGLRAAEFETKLSDKRVTVTTKDNENLSLPYLKMDMDTASSDFTKFTAMSELLSDIKIKGFPVHYLIANEKEVTMFITPYANIMKLNKNGFLILRGGL